MRSRGGTQPPAPQGPRRRTVGGRGAGPDAGRESPSAAPPERSSATPWEPPAAWYHDTLDAMLEGCMVIAPDWTYLYVNEAAARHGHTTREAILGRTMVDCYPGVEASPIFAAYRRCMEDRQPQVIESPFAFPDGKVDWFELRVEPVPEGILVLSLDITERKAAERTRAQLAAIVDSSTDAIFSKALDGTILTWNRGAEAIYGYTAEEVIGRSVEILAPPGHPDDIPEILARVARGERVERLETVRRRKDGALIDVWLTVSPVVDSRGVISGASTIAHDVTDRKRAEDERRAASVYARNLIEASLDPLVTISPAGTITDVNRATEQVTGVGRAVLIGTDFSGYFTDPEAARAGYRTVLSEGFVRDYPLAIRHVDGTITHVLYNATVYRDEAGDVQGVFAAARDVTERERAEAATRRLNRELRAISSCNQVLMRALDEPTVLAEICRIVCEEAGYRMAWVGYAEQDDARNVRPAAWAGVDDGYLAAADITWADEPRGRGPTGTAVRTASTVYLQDFASDPRVSPWRESALARGYRSGIALPLFDESGAVFGALAIYAGEPHAFTPEEIRLLEELAGDLAFGVMIARARTRQTLMEESLQRSEEKYRTLFEESFDGLYITSPEGHVVDINKKGIALLGFDTQEEVRRLDLARDVYADPLDRSRILAMVEARGTAEYEVSVKRKSGDPFVAHCALTAVRDAEGRITSYRGIMRDVTDQRRLEEQLRQSQKMDAIGRLAGGIAHDFNNLLTAINGYADVLREGMSASDPRRADVDEIRKAGGRAAELTRQLLALSRRQVLRPVVVDLNDVVAGLAPMLQRLIGEEIELRAIAAPGIGHVRADPAQLEQVILNLVVNARDAMPVGGQLTIGISDVEVREEIVRPRSLVAPGSYVVLAVSDTGVGMDVATMEHLFEPFFTTKPPGEGTGLGLATAHGIVAQSGGHITAYSEPGRGSTFRVYLPRIAEPVDRPEEAVAVEITGGSETILLVEDEEAVRRFAERILAGLGYAVLTASDATEAMAVASAHAGPIDLLVTDVMLPGMNGRELADALGAVRPATRRLYMSGYTADAVAHRGILDEGVAFLDKPFTAEALGHKVREVLDSPRKTAG